MTPQNILAKLVSFSVLGGQSNLSIITWIKQYLDQYGVAYHLVPNEDATKASLHCRIGPAVDGGVILSGHTDVVPTEGQDWHTNPFELTNTAGKVYARGSCDMKGFIACCLASVPKMLAADLKRPIYFAFSYDEEIGCLAGDALAQSIVDTYTEKPKFAIIGEPSMMQPIVGQKGIVFCETRIYGSAGHSSRIRNEVSAIHEAARLIMWLEQKMESLYQAGYTDARFEPDHTSIHIGTIKGGIATNVIADECSFTWDVRNIPTNSIPEIVAEFRTHCREREQILQQRFAGAKIETTELHPPVPALDTPEHSEVVSFIQRLSGKTQLGTVAYAAEAGQFSNAGFQAVICGPGDIAQAHRANEFVAISQLVECLQMIERLIKEFS